MSFLPPSPKHPVVSIKAALASTSTSTIMKVKQVSHFYSPVNSWEVRPRWM